MSSISASTNFEVNGSSGADTNGGGFDATIAGGTDYTQGAGVKTIVFDGSTIFFTAAGVTATIVIVGYTVLSTDVGNVIQTATSTGVTVGFFTIISVNTGANTWTLNGNVTSGAVTGGKGTAGGALASPGMAPTANLSTGNILFIKGSHTYSMANSAGSGGKISNTGCHICGYNTTRSLFNMDSNLPVLQSTGGNSYTLIAVGNPVLISSLVFANANANTGITAVADGGGNGGRYFNIIGTSISIVVNAQYNGTRLEFIAAINCTNATPILGGSGVYSNCVCSGGGGFSGNGVNCIFQNCLVASSGATGTSGDFSGCGDLTNCVSYGHSSSGAGAFVMTAGARLVNCIIANCSANVGVVPTTTYYSSIHNCAFYNNATDIGTLGNTQLVNKITLSATPFNNASGGDFSLNNTAGGGALLRALGWPLSLPGISTNNYADVGVVQHQSAAAGATAWAY